MTVRSRLAMAYIAYLLGRLPLASHGAMKLASPLRYRRRANSHYL